VLESSRLRFQSCQEGAQLGRRLAEPDSRFAELTACLGELGRDPLERRDRPLRLRG